MYAFIIITNKLNFSNSVKDYFVSMSPVNFNNTKIFVFGLDSTNENEIVKELKQIMIENTKVKKGFIFSDFGDSLLTSKIIETSIENTFYSKGSLLEAGFLAFTLINGGAPIESIMMSMNRELTKNN